MIGKLYITEYARLAVDFGNMPVPAGILPGQAEQMLDIDEKPSISKPFTEQTRFIIVHTTAACCIDVRREPKAEQGRHRIGPGERVPYGVNPGDRLAVVWSD